MGSLNKVMLIGNLGSDPEMKQLPSGQPVANFNLATTETWGSREGGRQEKTEWHRIVIYGKLAEIAGQYLRKGRQVYLEGRLQTRSWQDQQGQKRFMTEVVVRDMVMLGSRATGDAAGDPGTPRYSRQGAAAAPGGGMADFPPGPDAEEPVGGDFLGDDNDLPF